MAFGLDIKRFLLCCFSVFLKVSESCLFFSFLQRPCFLPSQSLALLLLISFLRRAAPKWIQHSHHSPIKQKDLLVLHDILSGKMFGFFSLTHRYYWFMPDVWASLYDGSVSWGCFHSLYKGKFLNKNRAPSSSDCILFLPMPRSA